MLLNQIQRKWVYLEPIFGRGALPAQQVMHVLMFFTELTPAEVAVPGANLWLRCAGGTAGEAQCLVLFDIDNYNYNSSATLFS